MKNVDFLVICLKKESVNKKNHNQAINNNILLIFQELGCKYFIRELCFPIGITEFGVYFLSAELTILSTTTDKLVQTESV